MKLMLMLGPSVSRGRALAGTLLVLCGLAGCNRGDDLNRQEVAGSVTLDGQPVETGMIRYLPDSAEATTETSTRIEGGKYGFARDTGPVPGTYKVLISSAKSESFELPQGKSPGEFRPPIAKETVPEKYNVKSSLTATVKAGQSTPIDFTLTSK